MNFSIIINKRARFTLLSDGLIRMEYSQVEEFENRVSVRLVEQTKSIPFISVKTIENITEMTTASFIVIYKHDGRPFHKDNLRVVNKSNNLIWQPGQVDFDNLGGVHLGMDCVQRKVIPSGVHPATTQYHKNSTTFHLWSYIFGNKDQVDPDAHYNGEMVTLEQLVSMKKFHELTPHVQELLTERSKYPPGILSNSGYFLYNDSSMPVYDGNNWPEDRNSENLDYYLFVYKTDLKKGLFDYRQLFGSTPMIPRYSLGLWFSRYPTLSQEETSAIICDFDVHNLPLDVLVLDLEWHQRGWYGFDWDLNHFPNPNEFIAELKSKNIYTTLNVHPDGVPVKDSQFNEFIDNADLNPTSNMMESEIYHNIDLAREETAKSFMEVFHKPNHDRDIDFWWIDGAANCNLERIGNQLFTNEVYQRYIKENYPEKRALICSRTEGLGSHRYPFHFTGDTYSQFEVLKSQVEYTLRAGHIGQSFMTHDIGGHMWKHKHVNPELLCRWYQFGAMSPIFRLHSSGGSERVPWLYDEHTSLSLKKAMEFRMTLLPYLYTLVWESHMKCIPMIRSNALSNQNWNEGQRIWDSYYLGDSIYCTPITSPGDYRKIVLPRGKWYSGFSSLIINSDGATEHFLVHDSSKKPPHFFKGGKLMIKQPYSRKASKLPEKIIIEFYLDDEDMIDTYKLYEDDGISNDFEKGKSSVTTFYIHGNKEILLTIEHDEQKELIIPKNRTYDLNIYSSKEIAIQTADPNGKKVLLSKEDNNHYCYAINNVPCNNQEILLSLL